jgi:cation-transporting ATPase E
MTDQVAPSVPALVTPPAGLTADQVADRVRGGRTNAYAVRTSRTVADIVRANVLTVFNGLLLVLLVVILATGRWQNGLFGLVIIANSAIGVVQELRAKRTLDRLQVVTAPTARVVRAAVVQDIAVSAVVLDDLLELRSGDQVPVDGVVTVSAALEIDEALLTGESEPVTKQRGHDVRSGSIVVAGHGRVQVTAVGADTYAAGLAVEAKRSTLTHSELVAGTDRLLRWISVVMLVVAPILLFSQLRSPDNHGWQDAVTGTVAALVGLVPEGLVLLTSLAFVLATVALARQQTLVQELPAVEGLARVDVVCLDKTGTLTEGELTVERVQQLDDTTAHDVQQALALAAGDPETSATSKALAAHVGTSTWAPLGSIPFSSARKWGAVTVRGHGTWVLGAPEMVFPDPLDEAQTLARSASDEVAAQGRRVLMLAHSETALHGPINESGEPDTSVSRDPGQLPSGLQPVALAVLTERVRSDAAQTLRYFTDQGVALKVISGDNPRTVGAIAVEVGVPGVHSAADAVDARGLPEDLDRLGDVLGEHSVFGRISPQQKRNVVAALQRRGHVVAMTGDGVNDTLALKDADVGVAMGNGAPATRAVAQLVLLDSAFSHLPEVVAQGRRVIANIERAAKLFVVKNVYSLVLAVASVATSSAYPLAPIQLTLISTMTIGVPGFFLALGPNQRRYVPGFLPRVLAFAGPTGLIVGVAAYTGFGVTRLLDPAAGVDGGRTTATLTVLITSLWIVTVLARPFTGWKMLLVASLAGVLVLVVAIPALGTTIFLLHPTPYRGLLAAGIAALACLLVEATHRVLARRVPERPQRSESTVDKG